jgi:hypothetical protein
MLFSPCIVPGECRILKQADVAVVDMERILGF